MSAAKDQETFGFVCSDGVIDLLNDSKLAFWNGKQCAVAETIAHAGTAWRAKSTSPFQVYLPRNSASPPHPPALLQDLAEIVAHVDPSSARLLAYFVIATWFADVLRWTPSLLVTGPWHESLRVIHALERLCRRAVVIQSHSMNEIRRIPPNLFPTTILVQPSLSRDIEQFLLSTTHTFGTGLGGPQLVFPRVIFTQIPVEDAWLRACSLSIRIMRNAPVASISNARCDNLRAQLLGYRFQHASSVATAQVDMPEFVSEVGSIGGALAACAPSDHNIRNDVKALLGVFDRDLRAGYCTEWEPVLLESLISYCNRKNKKWAYVFEVAATFNIIMRCRGESVEHSPKAIGGRLRELGIATRRIAGGKGRGVVFDTAVRAHIARMAGAYSLAQLMNFETPELTKPA